VTNVGPTSGPPGTSVTIQGVHFGSTAADNIVKINGVQATVTSASPTTLVISVPAGASTGKLTVETGGWIVTLNADFIVSSAAPTVTGFAPAHGAKGAVVTLSGTNFGSSADNVSVWINGTAAPITAVNGTTLTFTVPTTATSGTVVVSTTAGSATSGDKFLVYPTITGFSPSSGAPGQAVTITGTNLDAADFVYVGGGSYARVTDATTTSMTVIVPDNASSGPIGVGPSEDDFVQAAGTFTFLSPYVPTITSFSPQYGPVGTPVTLYGTNFDGTPNLNRVQVGGVTAVVGWVVNGYAMQVIVPPGTAGGRISVGTLQGTATSTDSFSVTNVPPPSASVTTSPATINAGAVAVGGTFDADVTVTNTGTTTVHVSGASVSGAKFLYQGTSCYGYNYQLVYFDSLAPGASCTLSVRYLPTTVAADTGTLTFSAAGAVRTVTLAGSGVAPLVPVATLSPASLTFTSLELGTVSSPQTVQLSNTGTAAMNVSNVTVSGEYMQTNNCPPVLAVGKSCSISVTFAPIRFVGSKPGNLGVASDASNSSTSLPLNGTGSLAHSGRLALYTRYAWGVDNVYVDGAWVGGNLKYDSQDACGGLGAITVTLAPGSHTIDADDNLLSVGQTSETVVENGCTVHQISGTVNCASPNFISGGYCYPPALPTCVSPQILQNGKCVTPGGSAGSGSGATGGTGTGGSNGASGGSPAVFDNSGGGTNAAACLSFGFLSGEAANYSDTQTITNTCSFTVYVLQCHSASTNPGTASTQCGANGRFFQQFGWLKPGETGSNSYSMPPNTTIWYGACSGGDQPKGKEVSATGSYICQ
jgi:hypothetical protein